MTSYHGQLIYRQHYVEFGAVNFQQTIGIPKGTNCAPLLADFFSVHL